MDEDDLMEANASLDIKIKLERQKKASKKANAGKRGGRK